MFIGRIYWSPWRLSKLYMWDIELVRITGFVKVMKDIMIVQKKVVVVIQRNLAIVGYDRYEEYDTVYVKEFLIWKMGMIIKSGFIRNLVTFA